MSAESIIDPASPSGGPGEGGGSGTEFDPYFRVTVDGAVVNLPANSLILADILTYSINGDPTALLTISGGALPGLPSAYLGKSFLLEASWDAGSTWHVLIDGRYTAWPLTYDASVGWVRQYEVVGKRAIGARIAHTDPTTGINLTVFNADPGDTWNYHPRRAGRSVGYILRYILDAPENAAALDALGIGGYATLGRGATATASVVGGVVSVAVDSGGNGYGTGGDLPNVVLIGGGSGAEAVATISGGSVVSIAVTRGGSGYTTAPDISFSGGGGGADAAATAVVEYGQVVRIDVDVPGTGYMTTPDVVIEGGTYSAATATVVAGEVTAVNVTGSADYQSAPEVWISPLPVATLVDLAAITLVPQRTVYAQGNVLDLCSDLLRQYAPCRHLWLDQDDGNTIRVKDTRAFSGPVTLAISDATSRLNPPGISLVRSIADCFQRVIIRGGPDVTAVIAETRAPVGGGATFTVNHSGGVITSIVVADGGAGYPSDPVVTINGIAGGTGATATATVVDGAIDTVTVTNGGTGYTLGATVTLTGGGSGGLEEAFEHDGLTNAEAKGVWSLDDWLQPTQAVGRARYIANVSGGAVAEVDLSYAGYGYEPAETYDLTITGGGGTGATAEFTADAAGRATLASLTAGGSGYTSTPTITAPAPPNPNRDEGTCVCTSTTEIEIRSADRSRNVPENYWGPDGRAGHILLLNDTGTGINVSFSSRILTNTAMDAGDAGTVTVETPLPATDYTSYVIVGTQGGSLNVWRRYHVSNSAWQGRLLPYFPRPVPELTAGGWAGTMTRTPTGRVLYSSSGNPPFIESPVGIDIDYDHDYIFTQLPVVLLNGTTTNLTAGGESTDGIPASFRCLLAVNRGNLTAVWPPDDGVDATYGGTSFTVEGLEETLTIDLPEWRDTVNSSHMIAYAREMHGAVSDAIWEGSVALERFHGDLLVEFGQAIQLTSSYDTPWTGAELPVTEARLRIGKGGGGPRFVTTLAVSTRRQPLSAEQFVRPDRTGVDFTLALGGLEGLSAYEMAPTFALAAGAADLRPHDAADFLGSTPFSQGAMENLQAQGGGFLNAASQAAGAFLGNAQAGAAGWLNMGNAAMQLGSGVWDAGAAGVAERFAGGSSRSDGDPMTAARTRMTPEGLSPADIQHQNAMAGVSRAPTERAFASLSPADIQHQNTMAGVGARPTEQAAAGGLSPADIQHQNAMAGVSRRGASLPKSFWVPRKKRDDDDEQPGDER